MMTTVTLDGWRELMAANTTHTDAVVYGAPTATKPAYSNAGGVGVIDISDRNFWPQRLMLMFYGAGAATNTGNALVEAWSITPLGLWIPTPLVYLTLTLGAGTGATGYELVGTDLVAKTIAVTNDFTDTSYKLCSPGATADAPAHIRLDLMGAQLVTVKFDTVNATNWNALYKWY